MKDIFTIALRNLTRNHRRTIITVSAIAFGLAALIFLRSFMYGAQSQMVDNIKATLTSDIQVIPKSQENIYNANGTIDDPEKIIALLKTDMRVRGFAEEIVAAGLAAGNSDSIGTFIVGLDPAREVAMGNVQPTAVSGHALTNNDHRGLIMGEPMRDLLGIHLGDEVVITGQDYYGALVGRKFKLVGTFKTGNDQLDYSNVAILLDEAREMLSFDNHVSKILINLKNPNDIPDVTTSLQQSINNPQLAVDTWEQLIPMLAQMIEFQNGMIFVVVAVILIIVTAGILNTLMMAVSERTHEFGLMMALGTPPQMIMAMVICESILVTLIGTLFGVGLGATATGIAGHYGLDLTYFTSALSNLLIGSKVYPRVDWTYLGMFVALILGGASVVSVFPALRASRLSPTEAMRVVN